MKKKPNWPVLLEAFEGSGLTHREFCLSHNINLASFRQRLYRWRVDAGAGAGFSQIVVTAPAAAGPWAEVDLGGGLRLRFHAAQDAHYLAELLTLLRP